MTGPAAPPPVAERPWWRDAVIYQVYPWSFADSDGDGVGDLAGICERLDHVAGLGVDAIWLGPVYPTGRVDWGYDVTDYRNVDLVFGGLEELDRLLEAMHARGLRLLMDWVPNHTSTRHPWFVESARSRDSPRRDWYVWADGRSPGEPPNNWTSAFGGSAWQWHEPSGQWFLASFYPQQADLNWANPAVRAEVIGAMRWWVERGVDGFRIDVVHRLGKDPLLRDNPGRPGSAFDENWPEVHDYVREMRSAVGEATVLLGEVWLLDQEQVLRYLRPGELDLAFNFSFATAPWSARRFAAEIEGVERRSPPHAWPGHHLSNHDEPRAGTRYGDLAIRPAAVLLLTLRGTPILYNGEEIGMVDGQVPPERRRDAAGRDGCRTPMQWDGGPNAGFCPPGVEPWLPVAAGFEHRNVEVESLDPDSVLALYRRLLAARRASPALTRGTYRQLAVTEQTLVFERQADGERLVVAVNFTGTPAEVDLPAGTILVATRRDREGGAVRGPLELGPGEALVVRAEVRARPESPA